MIILSIDFGDSRTGVAVCDKTETLASPVTVIFERFVPKVIDKIKEIALDKKAELIVVGYPKNMDSTIGERAKKSEDFAKSLEDACGIKTVLWDERLSTVSALHALDNTKTFGKKRKNVLDSVAAVVILQSYIDYRRIHNESKV